METSQQRFLKDPAGKEAQLVQGKRYHQEVPSWPQHLLTHPQVSAPQEQIISNDRGLV